MIIMCRVLLRLKDVSSWNTINIKGVIYMFAIMIESKCV